MSARASVVRAITVILLAAPLWGAACTRPPQRISVEAQRADGATEQLSEQFDEAWYSTDARNQWDFVLHRSRPGETDPSRNIEQTLHMRLFWKPVPGATFADSSQTNGVLTYAISAGPSLVRYAGAGFLYFKQHSDDSVTARIESATLTPTHRAGESAEPFGRCTLTGEFRAKLNRSRTAELIHEMNQRSAVR